ncbi:MAG: VRR-NUC domain-containing protein [Hydrogenophilales bacterium]|nr:VRR-NUC domain-containing protein [Hydrogenophilales bacterium]
MGKDSNESVDHDIWLLNEEYHYFQHIASDKSLASIPWNDTGKLFDSDVDSSLEALFAKNNQEHSKKRPDIAIFNQEGSAIIIEFKAPGVELQDHINDLYQYARLLAAKSNGKIKKFYGYLIGDTLDETRMPGSFKKFPSSLGYFDTGGISDLVTNKQYGELYIEVLFYSQFVERAEGRLKVYKNKLNIDL